MKEEHELLLEVKEIDVAYGSAKVLHGVSLDIHRGETVFLIGRNGAGKTTLLKTIAGFLTPSKGSIIFEGREISGYTPEEAAEEKIRYVFQDKRVFGSLTVRENIELAAFGAKEKFHDAIKQVLEVYPEMEEFLDSKARGLSGGQRQLLLIGRALIGKPKLLLIDEPTEGLAAGIINDILQILDKLKGQVSMLIVEQNIYTVTRLADRVFIMEEGKITRQIPREDIRDPAKLEMYL